MQFERITERDLAVIKELQPEGWTDIVPEFESYIRRDNCHPIKSIIGNRIVGIGAIIVFDHTGWLAHIIVEKSHRNQGIGRRITERLIDEGTSKSVDTLLLIATELGLPVYLKLGFRMVSDYLYFQRDKPWKDFILSPDIFPYDPGVEKAIYRLDRAASGENRRSLIKDYLENSLVCMDNGATKGVFLPDLGEGMILAETPEAGLALMKVKYARADKAVLPEQNHAGTEFLRQNGFSRSETKGTRMILGKEIDWEPSKIYSRIGGNYG